MRRGLPAALVAVALLATAAAALGIGVRATFGGHVAVDEVQYVLTAVSLAEDGDLDISEEWTKQRWRAFADVPPPVQTSVLPDGRQVSPHDPLLPLLLAAPVGWAGWVAAKATLAGLAGLLAALTLWLAVRRFAVPLPLATVGVGVAAASAPLAVYGQQLYPELPAALVVLLAVVALTGTTRTANLLLLAVGVTAAPWLSVKYVPVAAVLAGLGLVRWWRAGRRREAVLFVGGLAAMGVAYLAVHQLIWGGLTAYASGDHFEDTGELSVVGGQPHYLGRSLRLAGLLVDKEFGLVAWQPAWLLLVPAVGFLLARRRPGTLALLPALTTGWLVATFVALTMHGYWWPGRQVVVVLPLGVLAVLAWLTDAHPRIRVLAGVLGAVGIATYAALLVDGYDRAITWVSGFAEVDAPTYQLLRPLLPDYRGDYLLGHLVWSAALVALLLLGLRAGRLPGRSTAAGLDPPIARRQASRRRVWRGPA